MNEKMKADNRYNFSPLCEWNWMLDYDIRTFDIVMHTDTVLPTNTISSS